ncbi:MAG: D-tyrosyl-tRNA(Tyr) deacylase [Acidobacteria bacterium ADurb.Bin340]|nr:MAG: D-tyrosyl-tRNA(Tyr) deacylase [Acidobacteria bacterium ADurb.Bin340]HOD33031.1 D-aminoacyl-tRNA deacylase [Holophaga sp.]
MRVVVQRVAWAKVWAGDQEAAIGRGMLVLAGLEVGDTPETTDWVARKLVGLRIFEDAEGRMNLGLAETGGEILAVSQFTLAGSVVRGRRPSFDGAMAPEAARALFETFLQQLKAQHPRVACGFFQEHMAVELLNDGPVTFVLER